MTDVMTEQGQEAGGLSAAEERLVRELTERARADGLKLTGEEGLLGRLTKMVVEGRSRARWTLTSVTRGTTRPAAVAGIPGMAAVRRRC
jgi:hypothetical protein